MTQVVHDPDAELVRQAGAGDGRAAEALVRKHLPRMVGLARRMLGDPVEAEDVAQEVFLRVWREAPRWRPGQARFETWMHRVALNLCYDRLRRRRETPDAEAGMMLPDPAPSAPAQMVARERAQRVRDAMSKLPDRQRAALTLCHFQELTNIEAARALDVSVEALESLLARARRALRTSLSDMAHDLLGGAEGGETA